MTNAYGSSLGLHLVTKKTHQQEYKSEFSHKSENTPGSINQQSYTNCQIYTAQIWYLPLLYGSK